MIEHIPFPSLTLSLKIERWPLLEPFTISRGSKTEAVVVVAEVSDSTYIGRGEGVPYPRYGETVEGVAESITAMAGFLSEGNIDPNALQKLMPPGAARNALDCALWDYEAKLSKRAVWERAGLPQPRTVRTAYTISLDTPAVMAVKAKKAAESHILLKIKLAGTADDAERLGVIRAAASNVDLIVDANEGWSPQSLQKNLDLCAEAHVLLVEQPLPAGQDTLLEKVTHSVPICADESAHTSSDISILKDRYDAVNIKLDKTGGFTEALLMHKAAQEVGMKIMLGCMVSTSLSMAPALLLAQGADFVDLDGALLLSKDREHGVVYEKDTVAPPQPALWG